MLGGFIIIILGGHFYCSLLVFALTIGKLIIIRCKGIFKEVI